MKLRNATKMRRNRVLRPFASLDQIAKATDTQLREAGVDSKTAAEIRNALS